jgi:archaeal type IV pilus assembly protein PilA
MNCDIPRKTSRSRVTAILIPLALIGIIILVAGCILPAGVPSPVPGSSGNSGSSVGVVPAVPVAVATTSHTKVVAVTAQKSGSDKIIIIFQGGSDSQQLMELETTVTNSKGTAKTQSMGSRLATTPVQIGGSDTFSGEYQARTHVISIGHFSDGSQQVLLDTWL